MELEGFSNAGTNIAAIMSQSPIGHLLVNVHLLLYFQRCFAMTEISRPKSAYFCFIYGQEILIQKHNTKTTPVYLFDELHHHNAESGMRNINFGKL